LAFAKIIEMKKWLLLAVLALVLFTVDALWHDALGLHVAFRTLLIFFVAQSAILFRLDHWAKEEWKVQIAMVKVVVRLLSALVFALVVFRSHEDHIPLVIQFMGLYLLFMTFEITMSLANLRRN
jgi:hypothetical protein